MNGYAAVSFRRERLALFPVGRNGIDFFLHVSSICVLFSKFA